MSLSAGIQRAVALPRKVGLEYAYLAFGRAYIANGTQPGGRDAVLSLNAAAGLTWIVALLPRPRLFKCASQALLAQLKTLGIDLGTIPELQLVTELAMSGDVSFSKRTRQISAIPLVEVGSVHVDHATLRRYLAQAERLQAAAGEGPRVWEDGSWKRQSVRAALEAHEWWQSCKERTRAEMVEAMFIKEFTRSVTWARCLGVALEEEARHWIEPLQDLARAQRRSTISLGGRQPENVRGLRQNFTLGLMAEVIERWMDSSLDDPTVLSFLGGRLTPTEAPGFLQLVSRAAKLRNSASHPAPFDDADANDLERIALELIPLLLKRAT